MASRDVPTSPRFRTQRLTSDIVHRCLVMGEGQEVDPRRTYPRIGQPLGIGILSPILEIDIGPRQ